MAEGRPPSRRKDLRWRALPTDAEAPIKWLAFLLRSAVHQEDGLAYLGTQYVADRFRAVSVEGILFDSSLNDGGTNLAVFVHTNTVLLARWVERVRTVLVTAVPEQRPRLAGAGGAGTKPVRKVPLEIEGRKWVATAHPAEQVVPKPAQTRWFIECPDTGESMHGPVVDDQEDVANPVSSPRVAIQAYIERNR